MYELSEEDEKQIAIYCARATSKYNRTQQQGALNIREDSSEGAKTKSKIFDRSTGEEDDTGDTISDIPEPISGEGETADGSETSDTSDTALEDTSSAETTESTSEEGSESDSDTLTAKNAPGLGHALGVSGLKFSFVKAYEVTNYSFDGYFDLSPAAGNHFLVLEYQVFNSTGEDISLNVPELGVSFRATVDGAANTSDKTILLNDLSSFNGTIKARKKQEMVLLFQFDPQYLKDLGNIKLQVISDTEKTLVEMR